MLCRRTSHRGEGDMSVEECVCVFWTVYVYCTLCSAHSTLARHSPSPLTTDLGSPPRLVIPSSLRVIDVFRRPRSFENKYKIFVNCIVVIMYQRPTPFHSDMNTFFLFCDMTVSTGGYAKLRKQIANAPEITPANGFSF